MTSMLPDTEAASSRREPRSRLLDRLISKKRESQRHLSSVSINCDHEIAVRDGRRSTTAGSPSVAGPDIEPEGGRLESRLEELRTKLLVHLREAADRLNLIVPPTMEEPLSESQPEPATATAPPPGPEPSPSAGHWIMRRRRRQRAPIGTETELQLIESPPFESATAPIPEPSSSAAEAVGLWNLRRRWRDPSRAPIPADRHVRRLSLVPERSSTRARRDTERTERPRFSVTLTPEEIADDIYAVTGSLPRRRPRKRARALQRQLDSLLPGSWLSEVTANSYKVHHE